MAEYSPGSIVRKVPVPAYSWNLKAGISRSEEFEKKRLAEFGINVGLACGHQCSYCSSRAMFRCHRAFQELELSPFEDGYAIVDPATVHRVRRDAERKRKRGLVMLSTATDAWSPEARQFDIGRGCAEAILGQPEWRLRVLTKSAAVVEDYDVFEKHRDRVLVGLSATFLPRDSQAVRAVEPYSSRPEERLKALREASRRGLRTYGMLCPLLSPFYDTQEKVERAFKAILSAEPEEIFVEPVNSRARGLIRTRDYLKEAGLDSEAEAINAMRRKETWSRRSRRLIERVLDAADRLYERDRLRVLVYRSSFTGHVQDALERVNNGLVWL